MYYTLEPNLNEMGAFPQVEETVVPTLSDDAPNYYRNVRFKKALTAVYVPDCILTKRARRTDWISTSPVGFLMSDKLKSLVEKYITQNVQFFSTNLLIKSQRFAYWYINTYDSNLANINFKASEIFLTEAGRPFQHLEILNPEDFNTVQKNSQAPYFPLITKSVIHKSVNTDFFVVTGVTGGWGYFVSERLKAAIKSEGCTGMNFEPVSVA